MVPFGGWDMPVSYPSGTLQEHRACRHDAVMFEAEAMQRHFKLVIEGFSPPPGEVYVGIENPKGELGYYIVSDGTPHAYRLRIRPPSMINLQIVNKISVGTMIADLIAILGTIDMVLGEVDR